MSCLVYGPAVLVSQRYYVISAGDISNTARNVVILPGRIVLRTFHHHSNIIRGIFGGTKKRKPGLMGSPKELGKNCF